MGRKATEGLYRDGKSNNYYCRFYTPTGELIRRSTGTPDQTAARQHYNALRIQHGLLPDTPEPTASHQLTVTQILETYHQLRGQHRKDQKQYAYARQQLDDFYQNTAWDALETGPKSVDAYITHRLTTVAEGTINKEIGILSAAANKARKERGLKVSNHAAGKKLKEPEYQYVFLTEQQAQALIQAASHNPKLQAFIRLSLSTGMRPGEVTRLRLEQIDLPNRLINLPSTKSGRPHRVPINDSALDAILNRVDYINTHRIKTDFLFCHRSGKPTGTMYQVFRQACERAGIPITNKAQGIKGFRQHDQRHTAASWLAQKGEPLRKIQELLNHSSITQTERYAHLSPDAAKATADKLPKL